MSGELPLTGQVALVTGGSRGIGRAIVDALSELGADVAVAGSRPSEASEAAVAAVVARGRRAEALHADLADAGAAASLVMATIERLGSIDIVVNNGGITADNLTLRMSDEEWNSVIAVDLTAAFAICRAAIKPMLRRRAGRIINVASIAGVIGNPGQANYSAAKAGMIGMTKAIAREVGSRGITVNAIAPGFIATDMTGALTESQREQAVAAVPMGRMGTAAEVAAAAAFLASPGAAYVTGHVLHVDGGLAA